MTRAIIHFTFNILFRDAKVINFSGFTIKKADAFSFFRQKGGYIIAPAQYIQDVIPVENIVAFFLAVESVV